MFVVIVDIVVAEEFVDAFRGVALKQGENSIAREQGCLGFDILENPEDPTHFTLYETYTDAATFFDIHRNTAHFQEYARATAPWVKSKSMRVLTKIWPGN